jgi:formylmethanofuran dehydrogenase subunit B
LELTVKDGRIVAAANACRLAQPQFLAAGSGEGIACRVGGQPATLEEAVRRANEILQASRYPLVWGLGRASCEAQGAAIEIAERLGGVIDATGSGDLEALQSVGEVTSTLGEIRSRADLIVIWNADPVSAQPRFFERYAPKSLGQSGGCEIVVVDSRLTSTAKIATRHLRIRADSEFESATALWALAKSLSPDPAQVAKQTGVPLTEWQALLAKIEQSRYGAMLYGDCDTEPSFLPPLYGLIRTLNDRTRWVCLRLGGAPNATGAAQVLTWRTGYPGNVDFSHGYPRSNPNDFDAQQMLERGEVDAALLVCDDPQAHFSDGAQAQLKKIPTVLIDSKEPPGWPDADVAIHLAVPGVESLGTMFRMDGVPLALRPALSPTRPADFEVLRMLLAALTKGEPASPTPQRGFVPCPKGCTP